MALANDGGGGIPRDVVVDGDVGRGIAGVHGEISLVPIRQVVAQQEVNRLGFTHRGDGPSEVSGSLSDDLAGRRRNGGGRYATLWRSGYDAAKWQGGPINGTGIANRYCCGGGRVANGSTAD